MRVGWMRKGERRVAVSVWRTFLAPGRLLAYRGAENQNWRRRGGRPKLETRNQKLETRNRKSEEKRDFSLRRPTASQERSGKKKRRPAPFEMTGGGDGAGRRIAGARVSQRGD